MDKEQAYSNFQKALVDLVKAQDLIDDEDEMLSDWAIISTWVRVEDDGGTHYVTQFTNENLPIHVAIGLFEVGIQLIKEGM